MKKFLMSVAACLTMFSFGFVTTSCGSDEVKKIVEELGGELLNQWISNLLNGKGETYVYNSQGTAAVLAKGDGGRYSYAVQPTAFTGAFTVKSYGQAQGSITIPNITVGAITLTDFTIADLALQTVSDDDGQFVSMTMGDEPSFSGTVTVNGVQMQPSQIALLLGDAFVTNSELGIEKIQIQAGDNNEYVLEFSEILGQVSAAQ